MCALLLELFEIACVFADFGILLVDFLGEIL